MKAASHLLLGCVAVMAAGCAADQIDRTFDPSLASPRLYCPDEGRVSLSHLRLTGLGTTEAAIIRPTSKPDAPGRVVRKWTTAVIAGQYDIALVPGSEDAATAVAVDVRVACGPGRGLHGEARGERVRVQFRGGDLSVTATRATSVGDPAPNPGVEVVALYRIIPD